MVRSRTTNGVLETLETQIQNLENRKSLLLGEVAVVELSIKLLQAEHGRVSNQSAFISRLPIEILAHIFATGRQLCPARDDKRCPQFEVLVSHVTSYWRDVALSTPSLWTQIYHRPLGQLSRSLEKVSTYLARSEGCPIDITLHLVDDGVKGDSLISMVIAHVARWRRVFFEIHSEMDFANLLPHIRHSAAPVLEHLSICPISRRVHDFNCGTQIFTGGAPVLTFVRLGGAASKISCPPLNAVSTLHLEDAYGTTSIHYDRFCEFITASPSLRNLSLYGITIESWRDRKLDVPTLRSLRIQSPPTMLYNMLSAFEAPHLESLIIADCADDDDDVYPWTNTQFAPSAPKFPKLQSLTLSNCHFQYQTCRTIFRSLPTITHFALLGSFNVDILKCLGDDCRSPSDDLPWAKLHTLTVERLETVQESLLCATVLSGRLQLGRPIAVLRLESQLRNKFKRKGRLEWLEQVVGVEKWSSADPWPPGLEFVDENDLFWNV